MLVVRVLGPVEVLAGDARVDVGGLLPRRLLAALVAAGGQVVPDARLVDAVWGARPPAKAAAALQVYVSRLRGALGRHGRELLERDRIGYRLRLDPDAIDASWFVSGIDAGRRALAAGRAGEAITALTEALALWRGEPYADLESDEADAARGRLAELREVGAEELAAARLAGGDATAAVAELEELVRAAPLRERRWALLILGLYRCGRQGDALAAVRRVRSLLAEELGVDPGPELQELERRVLAHDPHLELRGPAPPTDDGRRPHRPLTSFLGRDAELATVTERLAGHRLVSLVGPAGVGKTRLAVEYLAAQVGPERGRWFARLADVHRPAELPSVVADAVGLVAVADDPVAAVIRAIGDRPGLLVLDNCEHLVDAAAELVVALTSGCARLRILATSREPLGVDGEVTIPVAPLPPDGAAVELLVDRVRAVRPGWTPSPEELTQARRIGAALDGLPLAIELAAARARVLGLGEIAERLDDRFALLGPVPRGSIAAHATLEAAIGWSVELLSGADRALLLRLWPFEGGFTLEAADAVRPAAGTETLESLSALVTRSVVAADTTELPTRYVLLESVRAYCRSLDPDPAATRETHARWVRDLAERCVAEMRGQRAGWYLRVLSRELPNIRAGLAYDLEHHPLDAVRSAAALSLFFTRGVHNAEAFRWVRAADRVAAGAPAIDRARLATTLIALTDFAGDFQRARGLVSAAEDGVFAELDERVDPLAHAEMRYFLAFAAVETRHVDVALRQTERAIAIGREHGIRWIVGAGRTVRAVAMALRAHLAGDETAMVDAAREAQRLGRGWTGGWSNAVLAETYLLHSDATGHAADALAAVRTSVGVLSRDEDIPIALGAAALGALALARLGHPVDAVRTIAAVHEHANRLGFRAATFLSPDTAWVDDILAGVLEPARRELARAEGAQLTWDDIVSLLSVEQSDAGPLYATSPTLNP